jgi:hypothetical protein
VKKTLLILAVITLVLVGVTSCEKIKGDKIVDEWEIIPVAASDTLLGPAKWVFNEDNTVIRSYKKWNYNVNPPEFEWETDTAYYVIGEEFGELFLGIHGFNKDIDGQFNIVEMNNQFMIIEQVDPYLHKEFARK